MAFFVLVLFFFLLMHASVNSEQEAVLCQGLMGCLFYGLFDVIYELFVPNSNGRCRFSVIHNTQEFKQRLYFLFIKNI